MTWGHSYPLSEQVCTVARCLVYKDGRGCPRLDSAEHHRTGLEYLPKEFPVTFHDGPGLSVAHIRGCFQPMGLNGSSLLILVGFVQESSQA